MKTSDYPYYKCQFSEFNKAQQLVVPFFDKDTNLVISLNTGTGKTALAECIFGYHLNTSDTAKVVYVSPFKSISAEKRAEWAYDLHPFYDYGVLLCNGDNVPEKEEWQQSRVVLITYESLDSKTRNRKNDWIKDVACFVFDEAHMLGQEDRGPCVEACLMRVSAINPNARIVFLSGTMGNARQLAQWLKVLNNKRTHFIESDWKPVKTIVNFHSYDDTIGFGKSEAEKLSVLYGILKHTHASQKTVVFVHSKRMGKVIVDFLRSKKIKTAFHNSGATPKMRAQLEEAFRDENSGFNVLISTSTLSAGVNL